MGEGANLLKRLVNAVLLVASSGARIVTVSSHLPIPMMRNILTMSAHGTGTRKSITNPLVPVTAYAGMRLRKSRLLKSVRRGSMC